MRIAFFDAHRFEREAFLLENRKARHEIDFIEARLTETTAGLAAGYPAVCLFVNDRASRAVLTQLRAGGTRLIALRSAGFNHVDLAAAAELGLRVMRVPEYSPEAVAEHAITLVLALNRKIHRAIARVRDGNFSLEGLVGFDLRRKTVGVIGTGKIGSAFCRILRGFGCRILAFDASPNTELSAEIGVEFVDLEELLRSSDIVSLHVPLTPKTHHLISADAIARMKPGVMIINTGRGALIDTRALIMGLKSGHVGCAGLDVYEEEEGVFFEDLSGTVLQDDVLARLLTFPNVVLTSHQAFLTSDALAQIAATTLANVSAFERGERSSNEVAVDTHVARE